MGLADNGCVRLRRPALLLLVSLVAVAAGCGSDRMSATDVANFMRKTQLSRFSDIRCAPGRASGWDFICTYLDPQLGREKIGVVVRGRLAVGSGSAPVDDLLPDGPHRKNTDAEFARRANALCAKRAAAVQALPVARNQTELLDHGQRVRQLELGEESRLGGIHPPDDEKAQVRAFMQSLDRLQRKIESLRDALVRRDAADVLSAERDLKAARQQSTSLARGLGLTCRY
jgi:hypothetical protein